MSSSSRKSRQVSEDLISNVPDNVADDILRRLPILTAARTSVMSKQWRRNWLSLSHLNFNRDFWTAQKNPDGSLNWQKGSHFISTILLLHSCPIRSVILYIPSGFTFSIAPWLSLLANQAVKIFRIITNASIRLPIASQIFSCNNLFFLQLHNMTLIPPPTSFKGFPKLNFLLLFNIEFSQPDLFCSLIANCRQLTWLKLENWTGMDHVVIDIPTLQFLKVRGAFESLVLRNVRYLDNISVSLLRLKKSTTIVTMKDVCVLARSFRMLTIEFNGLFCKFLGANDIIRSLPVAFNHLMDLRLTDLDLSDLHVFRCVLGMIESCPCIKELLISVVKSKNADQHKVDYNMNLKLHELLEIKITGITGSSAELKLIEYLLSISVSLEKLLYKCNELDTLAEPKVSRELNGFKRASPKARVLCMEN